MEISDEMKNVALTLATEWGENFRKPIESRLKDAYPQLNGSDLAELVLIAKKAESYIYDLGHEEMIGNISEYEITSKALESFPWIDNSLLLRLKGIAMFYARK